MDENEKVKVFMEYFEREMEKIKNMTINEMRERVKSLLEIIDKKEKPNN